jgi:hypothetical protein
MKDRSELHSCIGKTGNVVLAIGYGIDVHERTSDLEHVTMEHGRALSI